jgi:hypothetical protein
MIASAVIVLIAWWFLWPDPPRILASVATLEFESERVGRSGSEQELDLGNGGERRLRIGGFSFVGAAAADFAVTDEGCIGRELEPGESCAVRIRYRPTAAGERLAQLEIAGRARNSPLRLTLRGSAVAPAVGLAPERMDFGAVQVRGAEGERRLTISNIGSAPLELGRVRFEGPHAKEFSRDRRCPRTTLDSGEACSFEVRFAPEAAGIRRAELVIESDAPGKEVRLDLTGQGVWEGPPLESDPESLIFGEQRINVRSRPRGVRLVNRSGEAVPVAAVTVLPESSPFVVVTDGCGGRVLVSGEGCEVDLAVTPTVEGGTGAALEARFEETFSSLQVALSARGVAPELSVETSVLDFGTRRASFESAARAASLANTGSATLRVRKVSLGGSDAGAFRIKGDGCTGASLAPGRKCEIRVAFQPPSAGGRKAVLQVEPGEGLPPLTVRLQGVGIVAGLAVSSRRLDWGPVLVGHDGEQQIVVANTGSARLEIGGLKISGEARDDFQVQRIGCRLDAGLESDERCELVILFAPSTNRHRAATLEISHNGPDSPGRIELLGVGRPAQPIFRASKTEFRFGAVALGGRSEISTLILSNPGSLWLSIRAIAVRGENAEDFELVPGTCDGVSALAPGGQCSVGVRFVPVSAGRRRATLQVLHGATNSPALISLAGTGR